MYGCLTVCCQRHSVESGSQGAEKKKWERHILWKFLINAILTTFHAVCKSITCTKSIEHAKARRRRRRKKQRIFELGSQSSADSLWYKYYKRTNGAWRKLRMKATERTGKKTSVGKNALTTKIILFHVFIAVLRANQKLSSYCRHSLSFPLPRERHTHSLSPAHKHKFELTNFQRHLFKTRPRSKFRILFDI